MTHPKAARISPDSRPIAYGSAALASAIYLGAFGASFFGQASLASFMLIPQQLQYVVPAVVDLALLLFTLATLVRRSRGESTVVTNMATGFWTAVSIAANVFHVLIPAGPLASWTAGTYVGASLSALMPLAALGAGLVIENVLIARAGVEAIAVEGVEVLALDTEPGSQGDMVPVVVRAERETPTAGPADLSDVSPPAVTVRSVIPEAQPLPVTPRVAAVTPLLPTPKTAPERQPVQALTIDWAALSEAEKSELVWKLKEERMSNPNIAKKVGVSVSTIKRIPAPELQPA